MSLASKIAALAALLVIAATLTLFFLVRTSIERTVVNREEERLDRATTLAGHELCAQITRGMADVRVAAQSPSVSGLVQSIVAAKTGATAALSQDDWEAQVERYFRAVMGSNPIYIQIQLIGAADDGREILKVDRKGDGVVRVPQDELQQKGDQSYFKNTITQRPGVVHVTPIELNQELGKLEAPHRPVVRVGSVVTTEDGSVFGIVVINIDFSLLLKDITTLSTEPLTLYMTTPAGDYLVAPDVSKVFGFELGHRHLIQDDLPWLSESFEGDARLGRSHSYRSGDILTHTVAVDAGEGNLQQTWVIVGSLDLKRSAADFIDFRRQLILAAAVLIGLGILAALFFSRRITAPLRRLTAALKTVGAGDFDVDLDGSPANSELQDVKSAFEAMRDAVKSREQSLSDAQARIEAIVESTVSPIITIDERGSILHVNRATSRMFGYTAAELKGQNVSMLMPGEAKIIGEGREVMALRKDGSTLPAELGVAEVKLGTGRTFVATLTDLTEVKKLETLKLEKVESALKLEKMKGEFVATVSHELRTPLTSIKGSLSLLASDRFGVLPEKAKTMIEIAHTNSNRLVRLINDILDIEKIKAGQMSFAIQTVAVSALLQEAARANASYAEQFGVGIRLACVADDLTIKADPHRVAQALTNLISNAVKNSPKGSAVTLSAKPREGFVRISVADKGHGIPKEFQEQVFTRFAQADSSGARRKGGTGLGLCITKAIAEALGGEIGYRTAEGKGTTFFVDLPMGAAIDEACRQAPNEEHGRKAGAF